MRLLGQTPATHTLSSWEVAAFLARHPVIASKVATHNALALTHDCNNITAPWSIWDPFAISGPIPGAGLSVEDSEHGTVVVFPDAECNLHYTAVVEPGTFDPSQLDLPTYESPPAEGSVLEDIAAGLGTVGGLVGLGVLFYLANKGAR